MPPKLDVQVSEVHGQTDITECLTGLDSVPVGGFFQPLSSAGTGQAKSAEIVNSNHQEFTVPGGAIHCRFKLKRKILRELVFRTVRTLHRGSSAIYYISGVPTQRKQAALRLILTWF